MSTLRELRCTPIAIPVNRPTRISTRTLAKREYLLVELECDNSGCIGLGYVYAGTSGARLLTGIILDVLEPILREGDTDDVFEMWNRAYQETLLIGRRGAVLRALSAIDIALWDLAAKRSSLPLAMLLGGSAKPIPVYASGGYYRDDVDAVEAVGAEIRHNRSLGFTDHKIKVGGLPVADDANRVAAAVQAMEGTGRLAIDANNAYPNAHEALRAIRALEHAAGDTGLWWVEEPLSPDDIPGHAELARVLETPIATGEIAQTRFEFRDLIDRGAADILQPDAGVVGGVSEWLKVARAAEVFGIPVAPHWHANLHVHLAAATPNCVAVEHFELEKDIYNFEILLDQRSRLNVADGHAHISPRPGIGIELDPLQVRKYALPTR